MSAGYDGNITLGVSVTADSKSVVAELGALRKQIVDMFSSVDKSLAGGSGSFSNLEKSLSKIATDVGDIAKAIRGLPTGQTAKLVEDIKEVGTAAQKSGDVVKSALDFDVKTASTEALYQKLKQLKNEMAEISDQMQSEGYSSTQVHNTKAYRSRAYQSNKISQELRNNRGYDDLIDYKPAFGVAGVSDAVSIERLQNALSEASNALVQLQAELANMNEADDGFAERTARAEELTEAIARLNSMIQTEQTKLDSPDESTDKPLPTKRPSPSARDLLWKENQYVFDTKYAEIAKAKGEEAAKAFQTAWQDYFARGGAAASLEFAKSFQLPTLGDDGQIAKYQTELAALQAKMSDSNKLKITMSDEEIGRTLNRIEELKAKIAELTKDAQFMTLDTPFDDGLREQLMQAQELQTKIRQYQQTGIGFGSMEEAQTASANLARLTQSISEYLRNLDPAVQKLNDYRQALADVGTAEASMKSGKELTAEEAAQYEAASAKVKEYANDLGSLIQIRNALAAQIDKFEKTGVGMDNAEVEQSKTLLSELHARINQLNGNQPKFDMTISNQSIVDAKRNLDELIAKKKQMEAQGMGRGYAEYDALCAQLDRARQRYDSLTDASNRATTAMRGIQKANSALNRIGSTIRRLIKHVGSLITSFRMLGSAGSLAGLDISKGFKRGFTSFLKYGLGIRSIFMLFRRLRSSAVSAFDAMAQSDSGLNAELAHTKELMQNFKLSIGTAVQPLVSALLPAINAIIAALTRALTAIGTFFAALTGQGYIYKATAEGIAGVGGAAKKAKADLMGFDELNKLSDDDDGGGGGGFEKVPIDPNDTIAKFAEMLRQAWESGDFTDVGAFLGEKLKEGLEKLNTWITTEGFALSKKLGNSFATLINGFISVEDLPKTIGEAVGNAINMAMIGLHQFLTVTEWLNVGKFVADTIMSFFHNIQWELLGQTVGSYIMAFVDSIYGFITNIDFEAIGKYIATAINNIFDVMGTVDETGLNGWQKLGKSLSDGITGLLEMILKAIKEVDWGKIGQAIGEFIGSIDWGKLVIDFSGLVAAILAGIAEAFASWAGENPISATICGLIVAAIAGIKVGSILLAMSNFIDKLAPQLGSLFSKFGVSKKLGESAASGGSVVGEINTAGETVSQVDSSVSGLTSKLTSLVKNLALGLVIILEVVAAVAIVVAAIWALGWALEKVGEAWEPVISNGELITTAIVLGTAILAGIGVVTALLGSVGTTLITNIALGIAMLALLGVSAGLFVAEIWAIGVALEQIGIAWQPVLANGDSITQAILVGTGLLVAIGVAAALLGVATVASAGALPLAIALGTAMLIELGVATEVFIGEVTKIGETLVGVISAWEPVLSNGESVKDAIKTGTNLLLDIGIITAGLGTLTVASAGLLPVAIKIGTDMISRLSDAFVEFSDELIVLSKKLNNDLYPELTKLNSNLPTISDCMKNFKDFMGEFAKYMADFSGDAITSGLSSVVRKIVGFFTGDPIKEFADSVNRQHTQFNNLISALEMTIPVIQSATQLLQEYKQSVEQLKAEADGLSLGSVIKVQLDVSVTVIQTSIGEIMSVMNSAWAAITTATSIAWAGISEVLMSIWSTIVIWFQEQWLLFQENWTLFWSTLQQVIVDIWTAISEFFVEKWTAIQTLFSTVLTFIQTLITTVFTAIKTVATNIWTAITNYITTVLEVIHGIFSTVFTNIYNAVTSKFTEMKTSLSTAMSSLRTELSNALNTIKSTFVNIWNGIKSAVTNIVNGMSNVIRGVVNGIKNAVSSVAGAVRNTINSVIRALNGLRFTIPSWVPGLGGKSLSFNIPYLAQGAVLPPNKPFMAMVGDQKHGTNIEAPLDTIKQAVAEELSEYIDAMMAGFEAVVSAIDNKDLDVSIGDSEIGRAAERYQRRQKLVRGV